MSVDVDDRAQRLIVYILILLTAIGPFSFHIMVPALPSIRAAFDADPFFSQAVFSGSVLSLAVSTLVYGPIADKAGRRIIVIAASVLFLVGGAICAFAGSIAELIVGRIIQSVGGGAGLVLSRVILRDILPEKRAAAAIGYVNTAFVIAPMIAPLLGGWLTDRFGWVTVFYTGLVFGLVILALVLAFLPETSATRESSAEPSNMLSSFQGLFANRQFLAYTFHLAFSVSCYYVFVGAAPYVSVEIMNEPSSTYGFYFIFVACAFMLGNLVAARLATQFAPRWFILFGSVGSLLGAAFIAATFALGGVSPGFLFVPMMFMTFSQGVAMPIASAAIVSSAPAMSGSASGLAAFVQMALAGCAAQLVGSMQWGSPMPLAAGVFVCCVAMLAFGVWALNSAETDRAASR